MQGVYAKKMKFSVKNEGGAIIMHKKGCCLLCYLEDISCSSASAACSVSAWPGLSRVLQIALTLSTESK